ASPEYGGREAGAPGADDAAAYIAEQFAALGLIPLGDLATTITTVATETMTGTVATATTVTETFTLTPTGTLAETPSPVETSPLAETPSPAEIPPLAETSIELTPTLALTGTTALTGTPDYLERSYLQQFPVSHTHLISVPTLVLLDSEGEVLIEFVYHDDFVESVGQGVVENELVWMRTGIPAGLNFGGAIILQRNVRGDANYAAQLEAHGAGGLIVT
ncbi:MAG: hypothetical protein GY842_01810, partial [bacterium]|nr:hypothetical protein [bacterium]